MFKLEIKRKDVEKIRKFLNDEERKKVIITKHNRQLLLCCDDLELLAKILVFIA